VGFGSLAPGDRGEIVVTGYTVDALDAGDVIGNQASISSASEERDPSDNISYLSWTANDVVLAAVDARIEDENADGSRRPVGVNASYAADASFTAAPRPCM
jgi:hypothetical protein